MKRLTLMHAGALLYEILLRYTELLLHMLISLSLSLSPPLYSMLVKGSWMNPIVLILKGSQGQSAVQLQPLQLQVNEDSI